MIGETISHYRILEKIGAGAMGTVYKAEDTRLNRLVALKLLTANDTDSDTARLRFLREAQAASAINHPNVATIYEIDEIERAGGRFSFIAMEYVPGETLKSLRGQLAMNDLLDVFTQIANGLAEAHERGIVHRDLKPSNILITDIADIGGPRRAKILDFGVAKFNPLAQARDEEDTSSETASLYHTNLFLTQPGTVLGTFAYMSPEQARGEDVDHRSDIFSLGVVFYEFLAQQLPFQGSSALAVVDAILHATPAPVSAHNRAVSPALEDLVHRMLAKDRALRQPHLREVIFDLDAMQRDVSMALSADTYRSVSSANDPFATQAANAALITNSSSLRARAGKSVAVLRFHNITGNASDEWIGVGIAETVTADLKNIQGVAIIGRELIYDVLRRWNADQQTDFDEKFATRVGREVGARWMVVGGYQRFGEMLRITARFVEVESGEIIKTVKIDGQMNDIFALQDKIVYELSRDLDLGLAAGERDDIAERETEVIEAYEAYIKGMALVFQGASKSVEAALYLFESAITLDPHYAQAYTGKAYALSLRGQFFNDVAILEESLQFAQKAIELRPNYPDSYSVIGMTFIALDRVNEAIGALRRALAFAPDDALAHAALARAYFIGKGKFAEAATEFEIALRNPSEAAWVASALAHVLMYTGDYARAEQLAREAVVSQENAALNHEGMQIIGAYLRLGHAFLAQGRYDETIIELERELAFMARHDHAMKERTELDVYAKLVSAYVRKGDAISARLTFDQLMTAFDARLAAGQDDPFTRYYVACACALMGEADRALEHLERAIAGRRAFTLARARVDFDLDALRDDARFQALIA
ncbi:MAG: protein kinase [Acidobacteria bacterium]|nr:protein kinase [Acidobacteriota bacterium]